MDLKKERASMIAMLKDADVLVTNMRGKQLKGLGLHYDELRKDLPHLIVAHLSAWGTEGPDAGLPGFDTTGTYYSRLLWLSLSPTHIIHTHTHTLSLSLSLTHSH